MIFSCSSGHVLTVNPSLAGQKVRCPICREIVEAPASATPPPPEAILVGPPPSSLPPPPIAKRAPPPLPAELHTPVMPILEITEVLPEEPPVHTAVQERPRPVAVPPPLPEPPPYSFVSDKTGAAAEESRPRPAKRRSTAADDGEPEPDFHAARRLQQHLKALNLGLLLHYWKYLCVAFSLLFVMSGAIFQTFLPVPGILLILLSFATGVAAPILGIIGSVFCKGPIIPSESRVLVLTSVALDVASLALAVVGAAGMLFVPLAGVVLLAVSGLLNLAAFALFMLFLRKLATYLGHYNLAQRAFDAMVAFLAVTAGGLFLIVLINGIVFWVLRLAFSTTAVMSDIVWIVLVIKTLFEILHIIAEIRQRVSER
jgi:hypothetical protein